MQIVIFSYNFMPQNDAEAYCTARFANALAECGHQVHVVTMEHINGVSQDVVNELLTANVEITRIPKNQAVKPLFSRLWYRTTEWNSVDLSRCIQTLKRILRSYDKPILISRLNPVASNIVGWHCRKDAHLWLAHFSDPFPWFRGRWPMSLAQDHWCRRFINDADYCSVTCPDVLEFFKDWNPLVYEKNKSKFVVVPHIGEPLLSCSESVSFDFSESSTIAHCGMLCPERYLPQLTSEMQAVKGDFTFLQVGSIADADVQRIQLAGIQFNCFQTKNPRDVSTVFMSATINLVIDVKTSLYYTPFLPSKFAYLVFTEAPIVVFSKQHSPLHRYSSQYKDAGIYFADVNQPGALSTVISALLDTKARKKAYNRDSLREEFSKRHAVSNLLQLLVR